MTASPGRLGIFTSRLMAVLLLGITWCSSLQAESSVWSVTRDGQTIYLGGTVHLLRPSDYPLPVEYEQAYENADQLYFEVDLNSMNDLATQAEMLQQLTYSDERTLESVLNDEAWSALTDYTQRVGMPLMMMQKFKPGMVVTTLQVLEFQQLGFTPQGVDAHFNSRALGDGKSLGALESIAEQISFLAEMGEGNESEFILVSLEDLQDVRNSMETMISAWREGDTERLDSLFVADMRSRAPEVYEALLKQRNLNWLPEIEAMFRDADTEFVLVGAAHLVGGDGLLTLLRARGYRIEQL